MPVDLKKIHEMSVNEAADFQEETGREIWNTLTLTGVNRAPVQILSAFITTDFKATDVKPDHADPENPDEPAIDVNELTNRLLVDGSLAILQLPKPNLDNEILEFQNDLIVVKSNLVLQKLRKRDKPESVLVNIIRKYSRKGAGLPWLVEDIENFEKKNQRISNSVTMEPDQFFSFPNKVTPKGILFPYQHMYHRIEEIENSLRDQTGPASLALIVSGYVGDIRKASSTFQKGAKTIFIPGQATVTRVANNNFIDPMMTDADRLTLQYFRNMNITINVNDTATQSGVSRRIQMTPMLSEIERQRDMIRDVYDNWDIKVTFGGIDILSSEDKEKEMAVLKSALLDGVLTREEYLRKARKLFDLEGDIDTGLQPMRTNVEGEIG